MERWACVDVPALPLQILVLRLRKGDGVQRVDDADRVPIVVIDADKPQGTVLWVNVAARRQRIRPGMRYAAALALEPGLRAGVIDDETCEKAVERLVRRLRSFSPGIEPSRSEPGVFWLDASGFEGVFPSLDEWSRRVVDSLRGIGLTASVAVGFDRFGVYAVARQGRGARVLESREDELVQSARVPLDLLCIPPKLRRSLDQLGITDVDGLRRLPEGSLQERFGAEGERLQRFVSGTADDLLVATPGFEPVVERFEIEPGESVLDASALLFLLKGRLGRVCTELARRGEAVAGLQMKLLLDDAPARPETIRPADPTLDEVQLTDLIRLRLENTNLEAPSVGFELSAEGVRATRKQLDLFAEKPRRDLAAANRALARLRAEFGNGAVVRAEPRAGHLPEGAFVWRPLERLGRASAVPRPQPRLVRRMLARPRMLDRDHRELDGWCAAGLSCGPVRRTFGPYVVSGGWWRREVSRAYHFAETARGDVLWVYYDRRQRRWFLHGFVE